MRTLKQIDIETFGEPGWFFWEFEGTKPGVAVRCVECKTTGLLSAHSIEPDGKVFASINCCEAAHDFYVLDGWPSNLRKRRGEQRVEEVV